MTPNESLQILHGLFPTGEYPPNALYRILAEHNISHAVIQKQRGAFSTLEWMSAMGFHPVESEMQAHPGHYPYMDTATPLGELLSQAFIEQPFVGNVRPGAEARQKLYEHARKVLVDAIRGAELTGLDCDILTLQTVLLLQNWNDDSDDGDTEGGNENVSFWEFICNQYGIPYDEGLFVNSKVYGVFRKVTQRSLTNHSRLLATEGKRYYTTLLAHALAPKSKFFLLFEQIFQFYAVNLQYQFIETDTAFSVFSFAMKKRVEGESRAAEDDIRIKSLQSSSAIKLLFKSCPYYMALFVKEVIREMDALVATAETGKGTYLSALIDEWYQKRGRESKIHDRSSRQHYCANRVETDHRNIKMTYQLVDGAVLLAVPSIRLGEQADSIPAISLFAHDRCIWQEPLKWFGDHYCITTVRTEIPLDRLPLEHASQIHLRAVISYNGADLYCSEEKLFRNAIVFDDRGYETTKRPENGAYFYLYAAKAALVDDRLEDAPQCHMLPCAAQLYRAMMGPDTSIIVNQINAFPVVASCGSLSIEVSAPPVREAVYRFRQQSFSIYAQAATLTITTEEKSLKQYRIFIDDTSYPLTGQTAADESKTRIALPRDSSPHEVRVVDNTTQAVVYSLSYLVIPAFSLQFEGYYSLLDSHGEGSFVQLADQNGITQYPLAPSADSSSMYIPYLLGELCLQVPALTCRLDGETITTDWRKKTLWWKSIPMSALLEVHPPCGYTADVLIGSHHCPSAQPELGNLIRTIKKGSAIEPVGIILRKSGEPPVDIKLFDIAFEPRFETAPLLFEEGEMLWCPEENFIGDSHCEFMLSLYLDEIEVAQYRLRDRDEVVEKVFPFAGGNYRYDVELLGAGYFSASQKIYSGRFQYGDPLAFRFDRQAIVVTAAILDETNGDLLALNRSSCVLTGLRYQGMTHLNGEVLEYPCYEGWLQFRHNGRWRSYPNREWDPYRDGDKKKWEQVNPVQVWVINDQLIALRNPDGEGLFVNKSWRSITQYVPGAANQADFVLPDYYYFLAIKEEDIDLV